MIDRYTIKFGPAVTQKELEVALHGEPGTRNDATLTQLHKMKARVEFVGDFKDVKRVSDSIKLIKKDDI